MERHEVDALASAERQAGLLRRLVAGERVNDAVDDLLAGDLAGVAPKLHGGECS